MMPEGSQLSPLGRAAVRYARKGWYVFPLRPRSKSPLIATGFHAATTDLKTIRQWWTEHPDANIGAVPGLSGYVVFDIDSAKALSEAKRRGIRRTATRVCMTGRPGGGWHTYYLRPEFAIGNAQLADHIDVRCDKGYVVLPPSVHPSGSKYRWTNADRAIADLPPALSEALRRVQGVDRHGTHAAPLPEALNEGGRNDALTSLAGTLRRRNATPDTILAALREENARRCQPPLSDRELQAIAASVSRYEPATANTKTAGTMQVAKLSSVRIQPVSWLWRGYFPIGKLVMLDGFPGQGKSAVVLDIAARGSRGKKMPDGTRGDLAGPWDTLILTYEDDAADTLRPRIEAAGGDPSRVRFVKGMAHVGEEDLLPPSLPQDLSALDEVLRKRPETRLVIIDPLVAALSGKIDAHRDQDTRRVTAQLARIAAARKVCFIGIRHFRKHTDGNAITAGGGSIGFIGQARVAFIIDRHPDTDSAEWADASVLACSKCNIGAPPASLIFRKTSATVPSAHGNVETLRLRWLGAAQLSADQLLATRTEQSKSGGSAVDEWLRQLLGNGRVERKHVHQAAHKAGYPMRTVERAAHRLGVTRRKEGFGPKMKAYWWFAEGAKDAPVPPLVP